ncbi:hypothetical protein LOZ36_005184 [Ophidiomyces ophidiicola]|nr:hypothetical protein LOZ36_005184 [Ophidiomyces ophidiicola]
MIVTWLAEDKGKAKEYEATTADVILDKYFLTKIQESSQYHITLIIRQKIEEKKIEILDKNESMEKNDHTAVKIEPLDDGQMKAMIGKSATKDLLSSCVKVQSEDMSDYTLKENDESNDDT